MMILVHSSPTTLAPYRNGHLGVLCSPRRVYGDELQGWTWAADNDAYSKWDAGRYRAMLERIRGREGCLFVTAPDVVGDAPETMRRFAFWRSELDGLPVGLVAQDGLVHPPWDNFDALFIGGTTEWKLSIAAFRLMREAVERDKWLHMGRCNSIERMKYAMWAGCDSVDGTSLSWYRDRWLPFYLRLAANSQLTNKRGTA